MDFKQAIGFLMGFSTSCFFCLPNLRKWQRQRTFMEKLRMAIEALEHAEGRVQTYQERHERILNQLSPYYFYHKELEEALANAQSAMNEALEFTNGLRRLQMKIISSYPDEHFDLFQSIRYYGNDDY